ncbi:DUF4256 domain-containing protein [Hydrogenophaga palleronii]|uniref:DUF4256 domain-containing protein n=1 Tax=Hydrogenophaga palleronii TaxID=65655 RepID=UPI0008248D26|nr:DUF4256 domain-containing protein [Hydrogenophaga palleronii]
MKTSDREDLQNKLQKRFDKHPRRHEGLAWADVLERLEGAGPAVWTSLLAMEASGGEPDVIGRDPQTRQILFCDCSAESPSGRRSTCYDAEALASRKAHRPADSAGAMAAEMGIEMLDEAQYRALQRLGSFDTKTSSWIATPPELRSLGGALFGDRRYDRVFIYHNGAQSYYAARGFRGLLRV